MRRGTGDFFDIRSLCVTQGFHRRHLGFLTTCFLSALWEALSSPDNLCSSMVGQDCLAAAIRAMLTRCLMSCD